MFGNWKYPQTGFNSIIFLSVPVPVDLLVCVVPLLGKVVVANKREGLKMAEFEKCAFFKDIIKYHGNNDCYDDDAVEC